MIAAAKAKTSIGEDAKSRSGPDLFITCPLPPPDILATSIRESSLCQRNNAEKQGKSLGMTTDDDDDD